MKRFVAVCAIVLGFSMYGSTVSAQQRQPLPKPAQPLPHLTHFPVPASAYEQYVQWSLQMLRQLPSRYRVAQSDVDKLILNLKDCSSRAESDGYVTRQEMDYCNKVMKAKLHEVAAPYILQQAAGGL